MEQQAVMPPKLASAFVKAQKAFTGALRDSTNPHFKSKYADLASVLEAIKPGLEAHGLGFIQRPVERPDAAAVETVIIHESGETFSCGVMSVPVSKKDAQGYGSAMTYVRRYSMQAAFGIAPEDDDGNAATATAPIPVSQQVPGAPAPAAMTAEQAAKVASGAVVSPANVTAIRQALMSADRDESSLIAFLKSAAKSLDEITPEEAGRAAKALNIVLPEVASAPAATAPAAAAAAASSF